MQIEDRIFVAGHRGLVGSALVRRLAATGYKNIVTRTRAELDLRDSARVDEFFQRDKPQHVFLAAARVGGIQANSTYPAQFIHDNLAIQTNVIHSAWRAGTRSLLFLGSSCIYPRDCPQPIKEDYLLTGPLEPTNEPYAIAKIAGIKMCTAYNREYGTNFMSVMPTNLFGLGDNYDLQNSHVMPALIRKMHEARERGDTSVVVWGTGRPRREFLFSDDMADACVFLMQKYRAADIGEIVNIGVGEDQTILELAEHIAKVVGYAGRIELDRSKPDGTPQKLLDISRITALGWQPRTSLGEGLRLTYAAYLSSL